MEPSQGSRLDLSDALARQGKRLPYLLQRTFGYTTKPKAQADDISVSFLETTQGLIHGAFQDNVRAEVGSNSPDRIESDRIEPGKPDHHRIFRNGERCMYRLTWQIEFVSEFLR